jgi:hypothetical protein
MAAKTIIVLVAFPVLAHAVYMAGTLVLGLMLPTVLPLAGSWAELLRKGVMVAMLLVAVRVAFNVCRRLWPIPVIKPS